MLGLLTAIMAILSIGLVGLCMVFQFIEAIDPESKAFTTIKPIVFAASLGVFAYSMYFLSLMADFSFVWEFLKVLPKMFGEYIQLIIDVIKMISYSI